MDMSKEMLQGILQYLQEKSYKNACTAPSIGDMAQELKLRPGKLKAALYYLCGEGILLQDEKYILLLEEL